LVVRLAASDPSVRETLEAHLDENEGEILPYLFMADLGRCVRRLNDSDRVEESGLILNLLESTLNGPDRDVAAGLIGVSFLPALRDSSVELAIRQQYPALHRLLVEVAG
jgi:hypothetical protein